MNLIKRLINLFDSTVVFAVLAMNRADVLDLLYACDMSFKVDGRYSVVVVGDNRFVVNIVCKFNTYRSILSVLQENGRYLKTVTDMGRISGVVVDYPEK